MVKIGDFIEFASKLVDSNSPIEGLPTELSIIRELCIKIKELELRIQQLEEK